MEHVVIVGAGLAGLTTASGLRERGYEGAITLVGAEPGPPYDRPPLSKEVLRGELDDTALPVDPRDLRVDLRTGVRAVGLDGVGTDGVGVRTDGGSLAADAVVVATGAEPVRLPGDGPQRVLRTRADALGLRAVLGAGVRLVVVGAGWIGAEVATAARRAGCAVTVVEAGPHPLAGALPAAVATLTLPWWKAAGVDLLLGAPVAAVTGEGVLLADGRTVAADVVVTAVGVRPATSWLAGSGVPLAPDGAVEVDAGLAALPGVCAVGDVAAWSSARYGARLRVEHWDTALRAPAVVAATLLGGGETYDPVPYVWSEQFGRYLQLAGRPGPGDRLVHRGDAAAGTGWTLAWLREDGVLTALLAVDRPRDAVQGRRLAEHGTALDPTLVADPDVPLKRALA